MHKFTYYTTAHLVEYYWYLPSIPPSHLPTFPCYVSVWVCDRLTTSSWMRHRFDHSYSKEATLKRNCVHWDYLISLVHRIVRYFFSLLHCHRIIIIVEATPQHVTYTHTCARWRIYLYAHNAVSVSVYAYLTGGDPTSGLYWFYTYVKIIHPMEFIWMKNTIFVTPIKMVWFS